MSTAPSLVSLFSTPHDPPSTLPQQPKGAYRSEVGECHSCSKPSTGSHCAQSKTPKEFSPPYQALHLTPSVGRPPLARCPPSLALAAGPHTFALAAPAAPKGHELHFLRHAAPERHFRLAPISKAPSTQASPSAKSLVRTWHTPRKHSTVMAKKMEVKSRPPCRG